MNENIKQQLTGAPRLSLLNWICRHHPTDWFHEVGCPHCTWTVEQLQDALVTTKQVEACRLRVIADLPPEYQAKFYLPDDLCTETRERGLSSEHENGIGSGVIQRTDVNLSTGEPIPTKVGE